MGTRAAAWAVVACLTVPVTGQAQGVPAALSADPIQAMPSLIPFPSSAVPPTRAEQEAARERLGKTSNFVAKAAATGAAAADVADAANMGLARASDSVSAAISGGFAASPNVKAAAGLSKNLKAAGGVLSVVELGADVVTAHTSCSQPGVSSDCVLDSLSVASDVAGFVPVYGTAVSVGWTGGTWVGKKASAGYEKVFDESIGESVYDGGQVLGGVYDNYFDLTPPSMKASAFEAKRAEIRARAAAAYQTTSTGLIQVQQQHDREQAEIQRQAAEAARQQAIAQQQAAQAQANSAQTAALMNGILSAAQTAFTPTPLAPTGCHPGHDEAAHPGGCLDGSGGNR